MIDGIGASTCVEGVAVGEERLASERTDHVHHAGSIVRAYVRHVSRLTEMNLDGSELAVEINILYSGASDEFLKLDKKVVSRHRPEVREEYFRFLHDYIIGLP